MYRVLRRAAGGGGGGGASAAAAGVAAAAGASAPQSVAYADASAVPWTADGQVEAVTRLPALDGSWEHILQGGFAPSPCAPPAAGTWVVPAFEVVSAAPPTAEEVESAVADVVGFVRTLRRAASSGGTLHAVDSDDGVSTRSSSGPLSPFDGDAASASMAASEAAIQRACLLLNDVDVDVDMVAGSCAGGVASSSVLSHQVDAPAAMNGSSRGMGGSWHGGHGGAVPLTGTQREQLQLQQAASLQMMTIRGAPAGRTGGTLTRRHNATAAAAASAMVPHGLRAVVADMFENQEEDLRSMCEDPTLWATLLNNRGARNILANVGIVCVDPEPRQSAPTPAPAFTDGKPPAAATGTGAAAEAAAAAAEGESNSASGGLRGALSFLFSKLENLADHIATLVLGPAKPTAAASASGPNATSNANGECGSAAGRGEFSDADQQAAGDAGCAAGQGGGGGGAGGGGGWRERLGIVGLVLASFLVVVVVLMKRRAQ